MCYDSTQDVQRLIYTIRMSNLKGLNVGITLKDNIHSKKDNMWSEKESLGYFGCYNIRENKKISSL